MVRNYMWKLPAPRRLTVRRICALLATAALGLTALSACGSGSSAKAANSAKAPRLTTLKLATASPNAGYLPVYLAIDDGFFKQQGLNVQLTEFNGGGTGLAAALASQNVQVAVTGSDLILDDAKGVTHAKIFYELANSPYVIAVSPNSHITSPSQLVGKTIGISQLGSADYVFWLALLNYYHISPKSVTFIPAGSAVARVAALLSGKIDAMIDSTQDFPAADRKLIIVPEPKMPFEFPLAEIAANDSFISKDSSTLRAFVTAMRNSTAYARAHVTQDEKECEARLNLPASRCHVTEYTTSKSPYVWGNGAIDLNGVKQQLAASALANSAVKKLTVQSITDTTFTGKGS